MLAHTPGTETRLCVAEFHTQSSRIEPLPNETHAISGSRLLFAGA